MWSVERDKGRGEKRRGDGMRRSRYGARASSKVGITCAQFITHSFTCCHALVVNSPRASIENLTSYSIAKQNIT